MESAIKINNLIKKYETFTLGPINLEIPKGYITGIIGRNGAGKSTLIRTMLGISTPSGGDISVFGAPLKGNETKIKSKIGAVLGGGAFYDGLTVKNMTKIIRRFYSDWDDGVYQRYLSRFGINEKKKIKELSTGMREKYNIALALSHNADLIVMDEPSSGLDPVMRGELMDILADVIQDENKTIVLSTHITSDLDQIADFIIMLKDGKVLFNKQKDELLYSHKIVKGAAELLTDTVKNELIGYKPGEHGFVGLTKNAAAFGSEFLLEKPSIENIMRFYAAQ